MSFVQIDRALGCLNLNSKYGKGWKKTLRPENLEKMTAIFTELKKYLLSLKDVNHNPLYMSRRKTFIVGFVCTFHSLLLSAKDLFALRDVTITCLPTFRISQDFIETLFSKIVELAGVMTTLHLLVLRQHSESFSRSNLHIAASNQTIVIASLGCLHLSGVNALLRSPQKTQSLIPPFAKSFDKWRNLAC